MHLPTTRICVVCVCAVARVCVCALSTTVAIAC